jgi:hypothetical protein
VRTRSPEHRHRRGRRHAGRRRPRDRPSGPGRSPPGVDPVSGQTQIQLTNDLDADLTLARDRSLLILDGNAGDDTISLRGTGGITLDAYTLGAILRGGPGEDHLFGSDGDDTVTSGPDVDFFDGEHITTGNGNDVVNGDLGDVIDP